MQSKLLKHMIFLLHEKILGRDTYKFLDRLEKNNFLKKEPWRRSSFR